MLALLDADDEVHAAAVRVWDELVAERRPGVITNYTQVEAHALVLRRLGRGLALQWLLEGGLDVLRATPGEEADARALLLKHRDKNWSLCDAIAFAVASARGISAAFSFDHHFRQFGRWRVLGL